MSSTQRTATGGDGLRQVVAGILLMGAGVVLLLDRRGMIEIGSTWRWWPLVIVAIGLWKLTAPGVKRDVGHGLELMIFGSWILACLHDWMGLSFANSWPLVFVGMGVRLIAKSLTKARPAGAAGEGKGGGHA